MKNEPGNRISRRVSALNAILLAAVSLASVAAITLPSARAASLPLQSPSSPSSSALDRGICGVSAGR